jgi:glycosyltransferase involved in cell wall biosynthesis
MRIVIDLQGAQSTGNRHRGIGRYSLSLAQAIAEQAGDHDILLALNGQFPDAVHDIKTRFKGLIDPKKIKVWYPSAKEGFSARPAAEARADEKLYEAFLASLHPDAVHVSSLFEGLSDPAVTSIGSFARTPTAVTLYDLIPLINSSPYLDNPVVRDWYMGKVGSMRKAGLWLAISESSRQEGLNYLELDPAFCVNISTAAGEHFRKLDLTVEREQALRKQYNLLKPFVMYTGGIDHRKNIDGLIRAFALMPPALRSTQQLAIVCSARPEDKEALLAIARRQGLADGDVVITGFVPEQDLVDLYNLCALFVFPSWHEGFGLPALEAMMCGAPVIGANTSSLPEVIGRADAMFDPRDDDAIASKMTQALTDEAFRHSLIEHGAIQSPKFSWTASARRALCAFEALHASSAGRHAQPTTHQLSSRTSRPRLAYVSPLPPQRSGIAGYSAELLPELAKLYEIELITDLQSIDTDELPTPLKLRSIQWFRENAADFERVIYHFGNSEFHQHMFELLEEIPGMVVLHDFYLSGIQAHREIVGGEPFNWTHSLYFSHGYNAVADRARAVDSAEVVYKYPCNFDVLRLATGIIVHSPHSIELIAIWFGSEIAQKTVLIPLVRVAPKTTADMRAQARAEIGLKPGQFLVCAFGILGPTKLNNRLQNAWMQSSLANDPRCQLIFVGENEQGAYGAKLEQAIANNKGKSKISITGWVDHKTFQRYLNAADAAVQLRTLSRGETSAAVLDAMSRGIPTVVNANGSMAFLPSDAVIMLPDAFTDTELVEALERIHQEPEYAEKLGARAKEIIETLHAPETCAHSYADAIEITHSASQQAHAGLVRSIANDSLLSESGLLEISRAMARSLPLAAPAKQLFIDVSELVQHDWQSGIQRLVKSLLCSLFAKPPEGYRIEPVYAVSGTEGYNYARKFTLSFLGCSNEGLQDAPIDAHAGDIFLGLDLQPHIVPEQINFLKELRELGVRIEFVVYDLLPVLLNHAFFDDAKQVHERWLHAITQGDGVIAISNAVADEFKTWAQNHAPDQLADGLRVQFFHLGADISASTPTTGVPDTAISIFSSMIMRPSVLMVGTIEPRKNHEQALAAFEQLWRDGKKLNLIIVGKAGWMVDSLVRKLKEHPQNGHQLFWLDGISDEYLEQLYQKSSCLLLASQGEGFGLPLIEAAKNKLPIITRNIPVFQEVAGNHAFYFDGFEGSDLAESLTEWFNLFNLGKHPESKNMPFLTWQESSEQLKTVLFKNQ